MITDKSLSVVYFLVEDIEDIISKLDLNKSHGNDMISIHMLKLCDQPICETCLTQDIFQSEWKKANIVPIQKKSGKQCVRTYRPVSLLSICSKVLEWIIYNTMFKYFIEKNLLSENQSGFNPSDSCVNQLLATTHEIFSSFDNNSEVRGVFLDISKAFDKVWH